MTGLAGHIQAADLRAGGSTGSLAHCRRCERRTKNRNRKEDSQCLENRRSRER